MDTLQTSTPSGELGYNSFSLSAAPCPAKPSPLAYDDDNSLCLQSTIVPTSTGRNLLIVTQSAVTASRAAETVIGMEICKFSTYQACENRPIELCISE
jgi:hypothetical protein